MEMPSWEMWILAVSKKGTWVGPTSAPGPRLHKPYGIAQVGGSPRKKSSLRLQKRQKILAKIVDGMEPHTREEFVSSVGASKN